MMRLKLSLKSSDARLKVQGFWDLENKKKVLELHKFIGQHKKIPFFQKDSSDTDYKFPLHLTRRGSPVDRRPSPLKLHQ